MTQWTTYGSPEARQWSLRDDTLTIGEGDKRFIDITAFNAKSWFDGSACHIFINNEMLSFLHAVYTDSMRNAPPDVIKSICPTSKNFEPGYRISYGVFIHAMVGNPLDITRSFYLECHEQASFSHRLYVHTDEPLWVAPFYKKGFLEQAAREGCGWNQSDYVRKNILGSSPQECARNVGRSLSVYLNTFPDALQEFQAPSKEFKRKHNLTLRVPKDVQEDIDHSVSPHYRRGHMRLLSSERYTKEKRGKAVFVKGCFVKGKAYEVVG